MIILLILFLSLESCLLNPAPAAAQTPTQTTAENIQSIREVVEQKVKEKLKQISNPSIVKKAIVGKVIQIDATSATIEYQNSTRKLTLNPDTVYVNSSGGKITIDKIKVGQDVIAMGFSDSGDHSFDTKRLVLADLKKISLTRITSIGKITDISRTSPIFTLVSNNNKNSLFQIKTDTKTIIVDSNKQKIKLTDLKAGHKIIAILIPDEKMSKTYYAIQLIDLDYTPTPTPTKKK